MFKQPHETYLGDGVYASFDGWHVVLRVPQIGGDQRIALEPDVLRNLQRFIDDLLTGAHVPPA